MQHLIEKIFPYYRDIRQQLHANPELRYEEFNTAALVASELQKLGLAVQTQVGKTGVVGILDSGKPGKTLALRADMDALPMLEETQLPYQSQINGKMHACGHDGHTATLLATAHVLSTLKDQLSGKIKFIFQPAEEGGAGAKAMIDDGVLENPNVDAIFAFHNHPRHPLGQVQAKIGCTLYGNTEFTIAIHGKGGHAAQPETVISPIVIGSEITLLIQKMTSESIVSITQFAAGTATNLIPDLAVLHGTIRSPSKFLFEKTKADLTKKLDLIGEQFKANIETTFTEIYPATINTPYETEIVLEQARLCLGSEKVSVKPKSSRASEDFSFYLQQIPGCYFFIGNGEDSACCHNAKYDFNDELIKTGATVFCQIALYYLSQ
jgi:amidohydrolase